MPLKRCLLQKVLHIRKGLKLTKSPQRMWHTMFSKDGYNNILPTNMLVLNVTCLGGTQASEFWSKTLKIPPQTPPKKERKRL